jgi:hypothetical protein
MHVAQDRVQRRDIVLVLLKLQVRVLVYVKLWSVNSVEADKFGDRNRLYTEIQCYNGLQRNRLFARGLYAVSTGKFL